MRLHPAETAFSHLLISGTLAHEADFCELQQAYGLSIHPDVVMVVSIDRYPDLAINKPTAWRQDIGHKLVDGIYRTMKRPFTWIWIEEGVLALLLESQAQQVASQTASQLLDLAKALQRTMQAVSVSVGIGTVYAEPHLLHLSFQEAISSLSGRFFQGNGLIFQFGQEVRTGEVAPNQLAAAQTELLALVRIGDDGGVTRHMPILLDSMANACAFNENMFKSQVVDLVMLMSRHVLEAGVDAAAVLLKNARFVQELYGTIRFDKFVQKVCDYSVWLTAEAGKTQMGHTSAVVGQAVRYMRQNHRQNISLEEVARVCCLSKYHLSHLFKKEMGVGVIEFLNNVRVQKAVFYIQTTDWSMQQIASQVGFQDANYFSRIFRKHMHCSPTEFRIATSC